LPNEAIVGIDPGLTHTGYGIVTFDGNRFTVLDFGVITTSPAKTTPERLLEIERQLGGIIERHRPREAGVESLFFARNAKTALPVAEARGVILLCLASRNVACFDYTPLEIKQAVIGRGRAEKRQVQQMVRMILGLPRVPEPDHAADALAAAVCHLHYSHRRRMLEGERRVQQPER